MYYDQQNINGCKSIRITLKTSRSSFTDSYEVQDITIECGEKKIVAKSVLNVMAAGIKCGTEINLICDGEDEEEAMKTLTEAIESGLGEM